MERLRLLVSRAAQRVWVLVRGALAAALGEERLGRLLDATGLRALKNKGFLFERRLPDGNRLLYRARDQCIIEEIYDQRPYTRSADIKPGDVVVDCGGHIGIFALFAARRAGPSGRVIVCEPSPESARLLRRNVELNGLSQVTVREVALADAPGRAELFVAESSEDNPVADTLAPSAGRRPVSVEVKTLDQLAGEEGLDRIDLLKLDVEGAELRVMAAGEKALAMTRRLVMEVHPAHVDPAAVVSRLKALGFSPRTVSETPLILEAPRA